MDSFLVHGFEEGFPPPAAQKEGEPIPITSSLLLRAPGAASGGQSGGGLLSPHWQTMLITVVKQPFVNVEEKIDRFVGRRTKSPDALSLAGSTKADAIAWRKAFGGVRVPRGVYRFKTHEEADQWLWRTIARPTS